MCTPTDCRYLSRASHLLIAVSPSGTVRRVDPGAGAPLGRPAKDLLGTPLADIVADDQRKALARLLAQAHDGLPVW
ncbi:MAG: hypothetical protein IMZ66_05330, partial [Planctomycetes bacterium]|nr:hypothetical protein [Planctomycetota bacterium]